MDDGPISIVYSIIFESCEERRFVLDLDPESLDLITPNRPKPKEWTRLEFHKCQNCSLDPKTHSLCPPAYNLTEHMEFLNRLVSYEEVDVVVETRWRKYSRRTSLQHVAGSLIGIVMVTSGCPVLDKLRPMVEYHLPFASIEESTYRYVTMYLFAQYFLGRNGKTPDWELKDLVRLFDDIETVNAAFCDRVNQIKSKDAGVNAVAVLGSLGSIARLTVSDHDLEHWESLFMRFYG